MGPSHQRQRNLPHSMWQIRAEVADPPIVVNKNEEKGDVWAHLAVCLRLTLPSPPPLHPEPAAKSERRKRKEREKKRERQSTLAISESSLPHPPSTRRDVGHPGAIAMGEILRHRGGSGAVGRRPAAAADLRLRGAGVNFPAARGDRAESPAGLRCELRAPSRARLRRPRQQVHAGVVRLLWSGAAQLQS